MNWDGLRYACSIMLESVIERTGSRLVILDNFASYLKEVQLYNQHLLPMLEQQGNHIFRELKRRARMQNVVVVVINETSFSLDRFLWSYSPFVRSMIGSRFNVSIQLAVLNRSQCEYKVYLDKALDLPRDNVRLRLKDDGYHDIEPVPRPIRKWPVSRTK